MTATPERQPRSRRIGTAALARVEGEGAMSVRIRGRDVLEVQLRIYEPPRFFEGILKGRSYTEVPDVTARICGICPVAYQTSGSLRSSRHAVSPSTVRSVSCADWCIAGSGSKATRCTYTCFTRRFPRLRNAIHMAADYPALVERGLATRKAGNQLLITLGGRAEHSVNPRTGGSYRAPSRDELKPLVEPLQRSLEATLETIALTGTLTVPELSATTSCVALKDDDGRYPIDRRADRFKQRPRQFRPRTLTSILSRNTWRTRMPCTAGCATAARTWLGHSRATASPSTRCHRWLVRPLERRTRTDVSQPLPEHHRAWSGAGVCARRGIAPDRCL